VDRKVVDKSGAWFSYGSERIGQGRDAAKEFLKMHPAVALEIEAKIHEAVGLKAKPLAAPITGEMSASGKSTTEKRTDEKRAPAGRV